MSEAEDIVKAILEADDLDFDAADKEAYFPDENGRWEQIDGDYGDPWLYGGTFWNPVKRQMVHFYGVEDEKEIQPENVEVPPYTLAKIKAMVHDPDLDTPEFQDDPVWLEKQLKQEEWEVERKVGEYQYAKAAFLNARKRYRWEELSLEGEEDVPQSLQRYIENVKEQFGPEVQAEFDTWPLHVRVAEILNYTGWDGYADGTEMMSKQEASRFLGISL